MSLILDQLDSIQPQPATPFGEVPDTGAHPSIPADVYRAWDAISNSDLSKFRRSPMHFWHSRLFAEEPTPAMITGTAAHAWILEPDSFFDRFAVAPKCDKRTTAGKEQWAKFQAGAGGKQVLSEEDFECCKEMAVAIHKHAAAASLLATTQLYELSIVWDDALLQGVRCKCRIDGVAKLPDGTLVLIDLKTTQDASPEEFQRSIFKYGYFRQAAHYLDGVNSVQAALGAAPVTDFAFIAVEKTPPYAVGVYRISDEVVDAGRGELIRLKSKYRECRETNYWSAYGNDIRDIGLPAYAWNQLQ